MEDLSKYLPLYLGQKVRTYSGRGILSSIDTDGRWYVSLEKGGGTVGNINDKNQPCPEESKKTFPNGYPPKSILTLILRPLSSMTEEESKALDCMGWETRWDKNGVPHTLFQPEAFIKLIEWGFDIFGLKEKGLCIYENEL